MLTQAVSFATKKHCGQYRKHRGPSGTSIPYIFHPIETAKLLWDWGIDDENLLTAMVLHDVIEDSDTTEAEIQKLFNSSVAKIAGELTFLPQKNVSPAERDVLKANYIASFRTKSVEALVAKLADRFCNVQDKITGSNKSAIQYFHKADILFAAWQDRKAEVVKRFGQKVQDSIQICYDFIVANLK